MVSLVFVWLLVKSLYLVTTTIHYIGHDEIHMHNCQTLTYLRFRSTYTFYNTITFYVCDPITQSYVTVWSSFTERLHGTHKHLSWYGCVRFRKANLTSSRFSTWESPAKHHKPIPGIYNRSHFSVLIDRGILVFCIPGNCQYSTKEFVLGNNSQHYIVIIIWSTDVYK